MSKPLPKSTEEKNAMKLMTLTREMITLGNQMQNAKNTYIMAEERVKQITKEIQELAK